MTHKSDVSYAVDAAVHHVQSGFIVPWQEPQYTFPPTDQDQWCGVSVVYQ